MPSRTACSSRPTVSSNALPARTGRNSASSAEDEAEADDEAEANEGEGEPEAGESEEDETAEDPEVTAGTDVGSPTIYSGVT
jgi:hypothetical protein